MKLKLFLQIILSLSILVILSLFYSTFLIDKNKTALDDKKDIDNLDKNISSELINIEYNSNDNRGNTFYLNAQKALVKMKEKRENLVQLEGVVSVINLKNKGIINIYSDNAIYNKFNHNTLFYDNVKISYLNNSISSENLDLIFTDNISKIYNNVNLKNNNLNLFTDTILIDMNSGDINLKINNKDEKVKLIADNEYIN